MIELLHSAQGKDREAFEQLWEHFAVRLASFITSRLGAQLREVVAVDDILQDSSIQAFRSIGQIEWQGEAAFFSWLCRISLNVIRQHSRRYIQLANDATLAGLATPSADRASRIQQRSERSDILQKALGQLSEDHRQVIMLSRIEGLPAQEIAKRMNRSPEAVYQLLWRALPKLKEAFGDTESLSLADQPLSLVDPCNAE